MKISKEERARLIRERYTTCHYCGYNNEKGRLSRFRTCLRCGKIIDGKSYLKRKLGGM